jgi:hypothetical protein
MLSTGCCYGIRSRDWVSDLTRSITLLLRSCSLSRSLCVSRVSSFFSSSSWTSIATQDLSSRM